MMEQNWGAEQSNNEDALIYVSITIMGIVMKIGDFGFVGFCKDNISTIQ